MRVEDWRIPNEEEKKYILTWIKKHLIIPYAVAICFYVAMLLGVYVVEAWAIWRRGLVQGADWFILIFFTIFLGIGIVVHILYFLAWIEVSRMNEHDVDCYITDGKAVGYNVIGHSLEVTYFENGELKVKQILRPNGASTAADNKESGYLTYFLLRKKLLRPFTLDYAFIPVKDEGLE